MGKPVSPDDIAQHWVHSHEEDTAAEMVFRPASFELPPRVGERALNSNLTRRTSKPGSALRTCRENVMEFGLSRTKGRTL